MLLTPSTPRQAALGLTILRIAAGVTFTAHGAQKLFVFGFGGVAGYFGSLGIPFPAVAGVLVTVLEFGGGIALILGLLSRPIALLLAVEMLVAMVTAHEGLTFFMPGGIELEFVLASAGVAIALAGAGAYSLDERVFGAKR